MALSIKPYIENKERIHLIGIGGVSMNSLAELLLSKGVPVSGSDRLRTDVTARLEALGAAITYEHRPENVEGASLIVRTAAVHDEIQKYVDKANATVSRAESVRKFVVLDTQFTQENKCLTPSLKVVRPAVNRVFADVIDQQIYNGKR